MMAILSRIRNYVYDNEELIAIYNNRIYIYNFESLNNITSNKVVISFKNKKAIIKGSNIKPVKCIDKEIILSGIFESVVYE